MLASESVPDNNNVSRLEGRKSQVVEIERRLSSKLPVWQKKYRQFRATVAIAATDTRVSYFQVHKHTPSVA